MCFLYHFFQGRLTLPYLLLAIASVKGDTLSEHKKTTLFCEESGFVSVDYNVLLTTLGFKHDKVWQKKILKKINFNFFFNINFNMILKTYLN
jgi:hypothetical protein